MSQINDFLDAPGAPSDIDSFLGAEPPAKSSLIRRVGDQGIKLAQGVVGLPESFVGVADLATGGRAGKLVESAGVRFKDAKDMLGEYLSPEQKAADAEVAKAEGFLPTVGAALRNPSTILGGAMQSAPSMLAGGAVSRGVLAVAPKLSPILAGALGEGVVAAGQNAEQVRQEDPNGELTAQQSALLAGSGLLTGGISLASGKLANKLGIGDVQTMLATGKKGVVGEAAEAAAANKSWLRRGAEGFANEGIGQELPQSYQEQVAQNLAQGKPWDEGAANAGAMGALSGGLTGGGANILSGNPTPPAPVPTPEQLAADSNQANNELGAVGDQYADLSTQGQIGFDPSVRNVITPENVSGRPLPRNIVEVERQDGQGTTRIDRNTGPLSAAAADAVEGGLTASMAAQVGPLIKSYANQQEAQAALEQRPDAERMQIGRHPRATDRFAVLPKTAEALNSMDAKAAAKASNETRTQQVEQEDGNAQAPVDPTSLTVESAIATVDDAAHMAATSPTNARPEPTEGQKAAGNYPKGHLTLNGMRVAVENPVGSTRSGVDEKGKPWQTQMQHHYGYVKGSTGNDGDKVDLFIKPQTPLNYSGPVFVIDQINPRTGAFDEHKAIVGAASAEEAKAIYRSNYAKGWKGMGPVTEMPFTAFKTWVSDGEKTAPVSQDAKALQAAQAAQDELQAPVAQPVGAMPGAQKMGARMAEAARVANQTRAATLAQEETPAPAPVVTPKPVVKATPTAEQTAQASRAVAQEAADAEVRQSTGKESKVRSPRLPGESDSAYQARRAAEVNKQKPQAAKELPTKGSDTEAARQALGEKSNGTEEAVPVADLPDATRAGPQEVSKQAAAFIGHVAKLFGKRVVFVKGMSADGMRNAGNAIYLSTQSSVAHLRVLGHEMLHALKAQNPEAYRNMLSAVSHLLTDKEFAEQHKDYFGTEMPDGYLTKETREMLAEEWMADLSGNRFAEEGFWKDVFTQVEAVNGTAAAKGIIARLRLAIVNALNKLLKLVNGNRFAVDARMAEHLADIRKAVADGFAQYAVDVKAGRVADEGNEGVKFSPGKDAPDIQHQMEIERETRELATSTRLSASEQAAIGAEAKRLGITKAKLELEVRRIKAQFPTAGGWAPMEFSKVNKAKYAKKNGVLSMDTVEFQKQPYDFHLGSGGKDDAPTRTKRVSAMAKGISDEIVDLHKKAGEGDKNAKITMDQIGWYSKVATMLHHQFGGFADFLAQLMGPTSANTPVEGNVNYAMAALKSAMSGKWDSLIADTIRWHEGVMQAAAGLDAVIDANRARPKAERLSAKDLAQTQAFKDAMHAVEVASPYTGEEPQQDSGAKFGVATQGIVEILANTWSDFQRGDAPKTKNYYQNLIGRQFTGATIDVWAARTLRRMAGMPRIPTSAEKGVAGKIGVNLTPGAEFGFGQSVFTKAAENLRNSGITGFANTTPADVQAMIWFSEKENWARNDWTNKIGEGGSAEAEFNLQGNADREGLEEARRLSRKGLPHSGNTKPNKTEENVQRASIDAGVGQYPSPRETPQYKARLEKIIAKAVAARNEARVQFESMRGAVDRWVAGVTPATDFTPSDATMAEVGAELESKVAMGEDADKVLAFKAFPTMGRYGYDERSIDFEGVTRQGYYGADMLGPLLEVARDYAQDGLLFGRVLRADEDIDYLRHRPGMELYLAKGTTMEKAQPLLDKLDQLGFKQFTFVVDPVRTPESLSGKMGNVVGLRYIFTPEFSLREPNPEYGGDQTWSPGTLTDDQIRDRMVAKAAELDRLAIQLRAIPGVSSSEAYDYEANVYFWGDYDNEIGKIGEESVGGSSRTGWQGQPVRRGLEGADRRREMDPGSEDAKSFAARRDVLRGDPKLSLARDGRPDERSGRGPDSSPDGTPPRYGKPVAGASSAVGYHFSKQPRTALNSNLYGHGLKGLESVRLEGPDNSDIRPRTFFYLDAGNGVRPEDGVGGYGHRVQLDNLYNASEDRLDIIKGVRGMPGDKANNWERAVLNAGFDGYIVAEPKANQHFAVLLGAKHGAVPVESYNPPGYSAPKAPAAPYKRGLMSAELRKIDMPAVQAVAPSAQLRMGNFTVDQAELEAARTEMAKQGIELPEPKFSEKRQPFYSALSKEIGAMKMQVAPAFGWRDAIKGLVNKGLVKQDEIEWSGLNDWLELQTGKVTRDQVVQYLDANGVQVNETVLGDQPDVMEYIVYGRGGNFGSSREQILGTFDSDEEANDFIDNNVDNYFSMRVVDSANPEKDDNPSATKYEQYVLPGGENYREVLLTLPTKKEQWVMRQVPSGKWEILLNDGSRSLGLFKTEGDAGSELDYVNRTAGESQKGVFKSAHWDQKNVLAHLRVDDRTDATGAKVLMVQELQSDWGQDGKKKGFAGDSTKRAAVIENKIRDGSATRQEFNELLTLQKSGKDVGVPTAPFVTTTPGWLNLALKRVITMAVQGGYDKVAFVNGEQSAERYDLSKHIGSVSATKLKSGKFSMMVDSPDGEAVFSGDKSVDELPEFIGKELAEKIVSSGGGEFSGLDLKVGGEGMKKFYDAIVPNAASALLKKLGGGKMETVDLPQGTQSAMTGEWSDGVLNQPGFTITQAMQEKAAEGLPMFSKKRIVGDQGRVYTAAQLAAFDRTGARVVEPTLKERAQALWKDAGKKMAQGIADQFAPVKDLDGKAYGLLRLAKGASGAFEALLQGGKLKLDGGVYDIDTTQRGGVVDKLLKPLQGEHHDFMRWVAAHRAEGLMAQGKENLFTPEDIKAYKTLADGTTKFDYTIQHGLRRGQVTRNRLDIYRDSQETFKAFNKNVLDMAEQSGLIDGSTRHLWESEFYVPFYRVADEADGGVRGMNIKGAAVRQQAFKKLKGGKDALNADLLDNTLMNWAHLLDASAKNRAAKATIEAAEALGIAMGGNQTSLAQMGASIHNKNGVVWFMDGGVKRYSLIDNQGDGPYIMTALTSLEYAGMRNPLMNAMSTMKSALTIGVTASPFFKVRNLIRDSVQVIGTGQISYNPGKNLKDGWKLTDPKSDAYFRLLAGGGTIHFATMLEGNEAKRVQAMVESGIDEATLLTDPAKVKAFYRKYLEPALTAYNELGNRGEAVNRASLYDQLRKQGVSHADASLQARDLMDFSMQGSWTSVRFLTQVVPFMNARIQGLYKLGRATKEDPARIATVLGATALLSLSLLAAYHDDDDWRKRTDADRNNWWWFKFGGQAFRIPKPFEVGAIGTLAERGFELAFDKEMTDKRFMAQVLTLLGDNLSMNPVPQLVKPVLDVYANLNSFSGNPIENMAQQKLKSEYRFNDRTSMFARGASTALNDVTGVFGKEALSPVQIDHMLQGYFGWLGTFVVSSADVLARPATGQPEQATPDYMKVVTGNMISDMRDAPSRYVGQMYAQAQEIEKAHGTWRALLKEGKAEEAKTFMEGNRDNITKYQQIERAKKSETLFNSMLRMVERNTTMSADDKRERIRAIQAQKDKVARTVS